MLLVCAMLLDAPGRGWWAAVAGGCVVALSVALGRSRPLLALVAALLAATWLRELLYLLPVLSFLAGLRLPRSRAANIAITAVAATGLGATVLLSGGAGDLFAWSLLLLAVLVCPYLVGRFCRQYGELVRTGWDRAEQLEREQQMLAEQERAGRTA